MFVANSEHVARRIEKRYRRSAQVIHPPVDCATFVQPSGREPGDYYLMVTAFAPYKRVDLAIAAFRRLGRRLKIVGGGQDEERLRIRTPSNVEFLGAKTGAELVDLYSRCRALIFPGEEDFGIVPVEAQACGRPVIAFGRGGAVETVVPLGGPIAPTGILFGEQTEDALVDAVLRFEANVGEFDPAVARENALRFDRPVFVERFRSFIGKVTAGRARNPQAPGRATSELEPRARA
jgi:glycosyltransferase involved in cell wall biosynthesis